jgi:hypothetical protein
MNKTKFTPSESTTSFSFSELCLRIKKELKEKYHKLTDEQIKEIYPNITEEQLELKEYTVPEDVLHTMISRSLKKFILNNQIFEYKSKRNHLGGYRWYVICPKCKKSCLKLFLPNKNKNKEQLYLCKDCHELKNSSSLLGATNKYKKVVKPLKQLEAIKIKLLKRNMNPDKARELLLEYEQIERELSASPEYRLWRFQREHTMMVNKLP